MQGLIAKKIGMTRVFDKDGRQEAVTVLEVGPCVVIQRKTVGTDGYDAVQCGFEDAKESRLSKAEAGHLKKAGAAVKRHLHEFKLEKGDELKPGDVVTASIFEKVTHVDVSGVTKGRGFQGVMRRHGMAGGHASHGAKTKRSVGAIGCRAFPGRIYKGKRMEGHMGHVGVTTQNLRVMQVRPEDNLMLVAGAVAGPAGGIVLVNKAVKKTGVKQ